MKKKLGDIVRVPLTGGRLAFGQLLTPPLLAFFDIVVSEDAALDLTSIAERPVLFRIDVMDYAIGKEFPIIGNVPPRAELLEPPRFFTQDPFTGALCITTDGSDEVEATREECLRLEPCAAWDPHHVVDRLEDHFAGRPNRWVEMMRPK